MTRRQASESTKTRQLHACPLPQFWILRFLQIPLAMTSPLPPLVDTQRWLGLFEQVFRFDKWSPAVVTKMMDPRSGPLELFFLFRSLTAVSLFKFSCLPRRLLLLPLACGQRDCVVQALRHAKRHVHSRCDLLPRVPRHHGSHLSITPLRKQCRLK